MRALALVAFLSAWTPWHVHAQPVEGRLSLTLSEDKSTVARCVAGAPKILAGSQELVVQVVDAASTLVGSPVALSFELGGQMLNESLNRGNTSVILVGKNLTGALVVHPAGNPSVPCDVPTPSAAGAAASEDVEAVEAQEHAQLLSEARAFLDRRGITAHEMTPDKLIIYHLPDGLPAFPVPAHIGEDVKLQLVAIVPSDATAEFSVTSCDKVPGFRVSGSYAAAASARGETQGAKQALAMQAIPHDVELSCSGTLSYEVRVTLQGSPAALARSISIKLDPVYRFSWGIAFSFDFGSPPEISLGERNDENGEPQKFIAREADWRGVRPLISLTVHLRKANPYDWHPWNIPNLFLALDPTRFAQGFATGFNLKPIPELGILIGVSVFQSTVLKQGVTQKPGDTWTGTSDPATKKVFDKNSLGFLLGVELSLEVFTELFK